LTLGRKDRKTILRIPGRDRTHMLRMQRKAAYERDKAASERDKATKELDEIRRHIPIDLKALKTWMVRPDMEPTAQLPNHPLYWNLETNRTPATFPLGYCEFLGITGGGKTRRLLETIYNKKCIFMTAATEGNGGSRAMQSLIRKLLNARCSREQQRYWWTALFYTHWRFYKAFIDEEASGERRVGLWMEGSKCVDDWMAKLPEPPLPYLIEDAIAALNHEMLVSPRVLVDEMQAVPSHLLEPFLSACRRSFDSVVFTGTGVSADTFSLAWKTSIAGKNVTITVPGPELLAWDQVAEYWELCGETSLKDLVLGAGSRMLQWFDPCRARVAAVAVHTFKRSKRGESGMHAVDRELYRLTDPSQGTSWLSKNQLDFNQDVLVEGEPLKVVLAKLFLGDTVGNLSVEEDKRIRELLMSVGVCPTQDDRIREFMVMECLRRSSTIMSQVPKVMKKFLQAGKQMDPSAAGYAFEKCVATEIMRQVAEVLGRYPKVEVCATVEEVLAGSKSREILSMLWPDKYMGPDLIVGWRRQVKSVQCKFVESLDVSALEYAIRTTDLLKTYRTKENKIYPKLAKEKALQIRRATLSSRKKVHRILVLRKPLSTDMQRMIQRSGAESKVWASSRLSPFFEEFRPI